MGQRKTELAGRRPGSDHDMQVNMRIIELSFIQTTANRAKIIVEAQATAVCVISWTCSVGGEEMNGRKGMLKGGDSSETRLNEKTRKK